jgi:hypothetical protein
MLVIVWTARIGVQYRGIGSIVRCYAEDVGLMTTTISRIFGFPRLPLTLISDGSKKGITPTLSPLRDLRDLLVGIADQICL